MDFNQDDNIIIQYDVLNALKKELQVIKPRIIKDIDDFNSVDRESTLESNRQARKAYCETKIFADFSQNLIDEFVSEINTTISEFQNADKEAAYFFRKG